MGREPATQLRMGRGRDKSRSELGGDSACKSHRGRVKSTTQWVVEMTAGKTWLGTSHGDGG